MELDLWKEDYLLAQEWDLDMPVVQSDGQYGDLKPGSQGDDLYKPSLVQGSVEPTADPEDVLGLEWMESTDLGTFLDALDNQKILGDGLLSLHPSQESEDIVAKEVPFLNHFLQSDVPTDLIPPTSTLSVTVSPAQVDPVIKIESVNSLDVLSSSIDENVLFDPADFVSRTDFQSMSSNDDSLLASPSTIVSDSFSSSPESNLSNLEASSPELYKIITTSSAERSRFSPYSTPKSKQNSKPKNVRKRKPAEPVPEHIIMEHVNKKDRKKLQNKNAAIRYRMKKKEEATGIVSEEKDLEDLNSSLKSKVEDLQREIKYMKNLMEDVFKAKGISISI